MFWCRRDVRGHIVYIFLFKFILAVAMAATNHTIFCYFSIKILQLNIVHCHSLSFKTPQKMSGLWSPSVLTSDPCVGIFSFLFPPMKRCAIVAKIAGSIGILPCCVLNDFFTYSVVYECLHDFWGLSILATILCVWEIWFGSIWSDTHVYQVFLKQKITMHEQKPETFWGVYSVSPKTFRIHVHVHVHVGQSNSLDEHVTSKV